jgi:Potassium-transporting ATPase A subunit
VTIPDLLTLTSVVLAVFLLTPPIGRLIYAAMEGQPTPLSPIVRPVERAIYRVARLDPDEEQDWRGYAASVVVFTVVSVLALFLLQVYQASLPLNPTGAGPVPPDLAVNTAVSFATTTNWQNYAGETGVSHFTQMAGLTVQNFVAAAAGLATAVALARALGSRRSRIGNFWVDVTRATLRLDQIDDLDAMVVDVPQIGLGVLGRDLVPIALELGDHVPERPRRAAQQEELPPDRVDSLDRGPRRGLKQLLVQLRQPIGYLFEQRVVAVDDPVEQGVEQEAGVAVPKARFRVADALPDRLEILPVHVLECEQRRTPEEQADLVAVERTASFVDRAGDHEQPARQVLGAREVLDFRPFEGMDHVLDRQRMELILLRDRPQDLHLCQAVDVDPADPRPRRSMVGQELVEPVDLADLELLRRVVDAGHDDLARSARKRR